MRGVATFRAFCDQLTDWLHCLYSAINFDRFRKIVSRFCLIEPNIINPLGNVGFGCEVMLVLFAQQIVLLYNIYVTNHVCIAVFEARRIHIIAWCCAVYFNCMVPTTHLIDIIFTYLVYPFRLEATNNKKKNVSLSKDKLDETATFNFTCEHPDAYKTMREFMPKTFGAECFVSECLSLCVKVWQCEISIPHVLLPTSFDWLTDEIIVLGCVACFFIIHFQWYLDCVGV